MEPSVVVIAGCLGLLAFAGGVWRRSWPWWLAGYLLVAVAVVASLVTGGR